MSSLEPRDRAEHTPLDPALDRLLGDLSHVLWRLRDLSGLLVYRLEVQQLVLVSGRHRWVDLATEDVERAIEAISREEEARVSTVAQLAPLLRTPADASLRDLCEAAPSPWDLVLAEHQSEFLVLCAEAEEAARGNRELLHRGLTDVRQFVDSLQGRAGEPGGDQVYGARHGSAAPASALLVDREV